MTSLHLQRHGARIQARGRSRIAMLCAALAVSACSPKQQVQPPAGAPAVAAVTQQAGALLAAGYAGQFEAPPVSGPAATRGKTVWHISCGEAFSACSEMSKSFREAGELLGWKVSIVDGAASPDTASSLIRQAIAAKVDAVSLVTFDCGGIKAGLLAAREAKMPVVQMGSYECEGTPLFAAGVSLLGSADPDVFWRKWGAARAEFLAARLGCEREVLSIEESSQRAQQAVARALSRRYSEVCPNGKLTPVPFTFAQVPGESTQIFSSALLANPRAGALTWMPDALLGLGLEGAIKQNAPVGMLKAGAEGLAANLEAMRGQVQDTIVYLPWDWIIWGLADTVNRVLAGENRATLPSEGTGFMYIDREHNLPPRGQSVKLPVDFKGAYAKVWRGQP
ncbi:MAG: substrate-binding domain-containing protein [Pseudomonadota bacterium]